MALSKPFGLTYSRASLSVHQSGSTMGTVTINQPYPSGQALQGVVTGA